MPTPTHNPPPNNDNINNKKTEVDKKSWLLDITMRDIYVLDNTREFA